VQIGALGIGAFNELVGGREVQSNPTLSGFPTDDWHLAFAIAAFQGGSGMGETPLVTFAATRKTACEIFPYHSTVQAIDRNFARTLLSAGQSIYLPLPIGDA